MTQTAVELSTWTNSQKEEDSMFEGHIHLWRTMVSHLQEQDLRNKTVLDFGCNQGGFLRMLYNLHPFKKAIGVDIAMDSLAKAQRLNPGLPVKYEPIALLEQIDEQVDIAFSHEVIYLLPDLKAHAQLMNKILKPGGVYYGATGCHTENPLWPRWHKVISDYSNIPVPSYSLNDYAEAFAETGFSVSVRPFGHQGFVDYNKDDEIYYPRVIDKITYYNEYKMLFRFCKS